MRGHALWITAFFVTVLLGGGVVDLRAQNAAPAEPRDVYVRVFDHLVYEASDEGTGKPKSSKPRSGVLRIAKDKLLSIGFVFHAAEFATIGGTLPSGVCIRTTLVPEASTPIPAPPRTTPGPSPAPSPSPAAVPAAVVIPSPTFIRLGDEGRWQPLLDPTALSASRAVVQFGFSPRSADVVECGSPEEPFHVIVFALDSGPSLKIADSFLMVGRTRLPAVADPAVANSPNRQVFTGRIGANLFFFGEASGWVLSNLAFNVSAVDFDGASKPAPAAVFAIPRTRRALFIGWGYNAGATKLRDKDFVFIGTSFMGLKDLFDPKGKLFGGH
jgi:hypothetical protein